MEALSNGSISGLLAESDIDEALLSDTIAVSGRGAADELLKSAGLMKAGQRARLLNQALLSSAAVDVGATAGSEQTTLWHMLSQGEARRAGNELWLRLYYMIVPKQQNSEHIRAQLAETMTVSALLSGFAVGMALSVSDDEMREYTQQRNDRTSEALIPTLTTTLTSSTLALDQVCALHPVGLFRQPLYALLSTAATPAIGKGSGAPLE